VLRKTLAVWLFLLAACAAVWADPPANAPVVGALGTGDLISLPGNISGRAYAQSSDVVSWSAVTGATKYNLWVLDRTTNVYLTASENGNYVQPTGTTWTPNSPFLTAHIYGACVQAVNGDGWGPYSDWMNFLVGPAGPPAAPTNNGDV
jgi:beta-xylosidase